MDNLAPPRALTQKEKNLLHAKQRRDPENVAMSSPEIPHVSKSTNKNNQARRRSYNSIDNQEVGFSSPKIGGRIPPILMSSVGSFQEN